MKVGEYFDRLQIEEINKISYDIIDDAIKVSKDIEEFFKIFCLENEIKKHKKSFFDAVIYFCIYFNVLALHKSNKFEKDIIEIITVASIEEFSNKTNTDFDKNLKKYSYIKADLDDVPNNQVLKELDVFLVACDIFFVWAFDNELDTTIFTDDEYEKILITLRTAFTNIVEQATND